MDVTVSTTPCCLSVNFFDIDMPKKKYARIHVIGADANGTVLGERNLVLREDSFNRNHGHAYELPANAVKFKYSVYCGDSVREIQLGGQVEYASDWESF